MTTPPSLPPAMDPEQQRIAIGLACGWRRVNHAFCFWVSPDGQTAPGMILPDYLNSLDAMHDAEKVLVSWDDPANAGHYVWKDSYGRYIGHLAQLTNSQYFHPKADSTEFRKLISATAAQRAEAFLKCLNLWTRTK